MGNIIGKKDDLLLDFGGLKTENMSSTIPYMNKLNADAKVLIERINMSTSTKKLFNDSENYNMYKLFEKTQNLNPPTNDVEFSDTSPFISSDKYKNIVKEQNGGMVNSDFEESSSSTFDEEVKPKHKKNKREEKHHHEEKHHEEKHHEEEHSYNKHKDCEECNKCKEHMNDSSSSSSSSSKSMEENSMSGGYVSSVAHSTDSNSLTINSDISTISNKQKYNTYSDSINTTDINMISVDD